MVSWLKQYIVVLYYYMSCVVYRFWQHNQWVIKLTCPIIFDHQWCLLPASQCLGTRSCLTTTSGFNDDSFSLHFISTKWEVVQDSTILTVHQEQFPLMWHAACLQWCINFIPAFFISVKHERCHVYWHRDSLKIINLPTGVGGGQ